MIKQMDEMVSGLADTRRRAVRIAKYWGKVIAKIVIAVTLPVWLIPVSYTHLTLPTILRV